MSYLLRHEACSKCGSRNNKAVYSDGHSFCYSDNCGYVAPPRTIESVKEKKLCNISTSIKDKMETILPEYDEVLPLWAKNWLTKYHITEREIKKYNIGWQAYWGGLVLPFGSGYQIRTWPMELSKNRPKYLTFGEPSFSEVFQEPTVISKNWVVLTEDIISAIRVAPHLPAKPLCGTKINSEALRSLQERFEGVIWWLDRDKAREATVARSRAIACGFKGSGTIITDLDPKEYTYDGIRGIINDHFTSVRDPMDQRAQK